MHGALMGLEDAEDLADIGFDLGRGFLQFLVDALAPASRVVVDGDWPMRMDVRTQG